MSAPTYDIRKVSDFLLVPEDRIDVCLREFRAMLHMARHGTALLGAVCDETTGQPGAIRFQMVDRFLWTDDDAGSVRFDVHTRPEGDPERETVRLIEGTLKDEWR